jgi:hypothetical protein
MKRKHHILVVTVLLLGAFVAPRPGRAQKRVPTPRSPQFAKKWDGQNFSHRLYDSLLRRHVKRGRVDYAGLRRYSLSLLREYYYRLANTNPVRLMGGKAARLAFWINAHNALVLRMVLRRDSRATKASKRVRAAGRTRGERTRGERTRGGRRYAFQVGGQWYTLAQIRNRIIRARFKDPRALFALVRADPRGGWLRARAYTGRRLARRLRVAVRRYLAHPRRGVRLDRKNKIVVLPRLFARFQKDFKQSRYKGVLAFVAAHLRDAKDAAFVKAHLGKLTLRYRP